MRHLTMNNDHPVEIEKYPCCHRVGSSSATFLSYLDIIRLSHLVRSGIGDIEWQLKSQEISKKANCKFISLKIIAKSHRIAPTLNLQLKSPKRTFHDPVTLGHVTCLSDWKVHRIPSFCIWWSNEDTTWYFYWRCKDGQSGRFLGSKQTVDRCRCCKHFR